MKITSMSGLLMKMKKQSMLKLSFTINKNKIKINKKKINIKNKIKINKKINKNKNNYYV